MQNVVLIIHLLLALALMGVVLLQRSEGGGLGMGTSMGPQAGRPAMTGLAKLTWGFAIAFIVTSLALTVIAARQASTGSIMDQIGVTGGDQPATPALPNMPLYTPPPATGGNPLTPPAPDAPEAAAPVAPAAPEAVAPAAPEAAAPVAPGDAVAPPPAN